MNNNDKPIQVDTKTVSEIFKCPAVYASEIFIGTSEGFIRVTFAERIPYTNDLESRTAVVMPLDGLRALKQAVDGAIELYMNQRQAQANAEPIKLLREE